jgi:hypothetical protein
VVRETIRKTTTDIEFFGLSKPEVFEALADWYEYHEEEELNYLGLFPD